MNATTDNPAEVLTDDQVVGAASNATCWNSRRTAAAFA